MKDTYIRIRLSTYEKKILEEMATEDNTTMSNLIRALVLIEKNRRYVSKGDKL